MVYLHLREITGVGSISLHFWPMNVSDTWVWWVWKQHQPQRWWSLLFGTECICNFSWHCVPLLRVRPPISWHVFGQQLRSPSIKYIFSQSQSPKPSQKALPTSSFLQPTPLGQAGIPGQLIQLANCPVPETSKQPQLMVLPSCCTNKKLANLSIIHSISTIYFTNQQPSCEQS